MKNIEELLAELAGGADMVILNPSTKQRLEDSGVRIPEAQEISLEEAVDLLFSEKRKKAALEAARKIPAPPDIPIPSVQSLYGEIRAAATLGLFGAAITLSGILVEYMLKYAAYKVEMGGFVKYDPEKWDEFEELDFSDAIGRANRNRLLTKEARKLLHEFRERFRNPYNHYNIKKITSNYYAKDVSVLNTVTNEIEVKDVKAIDSPIFQAQVKPIADADNIFDVLNFANSVVVYLWNKIQHLQSVADTEEPVEASPDAP